MLFYRVARSAVTAVCRVLWRVRLVGTENLPRAGGFVLAPSHRSMMDIPFAAVVTSRRIRFMGKKSLFGVPVIGPIFRWLGGFPVARGGPDRKAVRDAGEGVKAGELLRVHPEGTRHHEPKLQAQQPRPAD